MTTKDPVQVGLETPSDQQNQTSQDGKKKTPQRPDEEKYNKVNEMRHRDNEVSF